MTMGNMAVSMPWLTDIAIPAQPISQKKDSNTLRRYKRNIIGDILHFLSRVPTDEIMAKQVKLDEEIRDRSLPCSPGRWRMKSQWQMGSATLSRRRKSCQETQQRR
jgi:hypothetical protein